MATSDHKQGFFTTHLLDWFDRNDRPLPWKGEKDPYLIWLSEIILQQTRVQQGLPYFERFAASYPTVKDLAAAPDDEVFKLWEGLGYYARARNMLAAARYIADELDGKFPDTYDAIRALKGVGPYTAAAIASFAYDLPHAVLDGNVFRVLSRFFGILTPIDTTAGKRQFQQLAESLLYRGDAAKYNQAIMDFGATQCKPKAPLCASCPLHSSCVAYQEDRIHQLPQKEKKLKKRDRFFLYVEWQREEALLLQKRTRKDIWQDLYEFPLLELDRLSDMEYPDCLNALEQRWGMRLDASTVNISRPFQQSLSHQRITARFLQVPVNSDFTLASEQAFWVQREQLRDYAFPRIIDWYLADNSLYLI